MKWLAVLLLVMVGASAWLGYTNAKRPLPQGLDFSGPPRTVDEVRLLRDLTWLDAAGEQQLDHEIFDAMLDLVAAAERLLVVDMFLFNDFAGDVEGGHRPLSAEFTEAVLARMRAAPELQVVFITDPFNTFYGSMRSPYLEDLEAAGARVVFTDLNALPDSNPAWSGFWRLCCRWLSTPSPDRGWLPNPIADDPKVALRSLLRVLNFKANHRKTLVAHTGAGWKGLVTSANIHDASSRHSNVALLFSGLAVLDLLQTERAILAFSGAPEVFPAEPDNSVSAPRNDGGDSTTVPGLGDVAAAGMTASDNGKRDAFISVLSEAAIRERALTLIRTAEPGAKLSLAMFYLAHTATIDALKAAQARGVQVRVLLDPNRDAFGREKGGVPNRQTAWRLDRAGIPVRWCNTRGEQCHSKLLLRSQANAVDLLLGSANFTRRNLDNFNPETSVHLHGSPDVGALQDAQALFDRLWHNEVGRIYSLSYGAHADHSRLRLWRARFMEWSGLSSF